MLLHIKLTLLQYQNNVIYSFDYFNDTHQSKIWEFCQVNNDNNTLFPHHLQGTQHNVMFSLNI